MSQTLGHANANENDVAKLESRIGAKIDRFSGSVKRSEAIEEDWQKWLTNSARLVNKDDHLDKELAQLVKKTAAIKETIEMKTTEIAGKREQISFCQNSIEENMALNEQNLLDFEASASRTALNFKNAYSVYSSSQLTKDIEEIRNESKKVQDEFKSLCQEMEDLRVKYELDEIVITTPSETKEAIADFKDILMDRERKITEMCDSRKSSCEELNKKLEETKKKILNLSSQVK